MIPKASSGPARDGCAPLRQKESAHATSRGLLEKILGRKLSALARFEVCDAREQDFRADSPRPARTESPSTACVKSTASRAEEPKNIQIRSLGLDRRQRDEDRPGFERLDREARGLEHSGSMLRPCLPFDLEAWDEPLGAGRGMAVPQPRDPPAPRHQQSLLNREKELAGFLAFGKAASLDCSALSGESPGGSRGGFGVRAREQRPWISSFKKKNTETSPALEDLEAPRSGSESPKSLAAEPRAQARGDPRRTRTGTGESGSSKPAQKWPGLERRATEDAGRGFSGLPTATETDQFVDRAEAGFGAPGLEEAARPQSGLLEKSKDTADTGAKTAPRQARGKSKGILASKNTSANKVAPGSSKQRFSSPLHPASGPNRQKNPKTVSEEATFPPVQRPRVRFDDKPEIRLVSKYIQNFRTASFNCRENCPCSCALI